ncbi:MAG: hypothetical protein ACTS27_05990, partial [Phycisphaerales bacterium]
MIKSIRADRLLTLCGAAATLAASSSWAQSGDRGTVVINGAEIRVTGSMFIDATSRIDLTGRGFAPGEGPGAGTQALAGTDSAGNPTFRGTGAGHGGIGGAPFGRQPQGFGGAYGDFRWPTEFGSGGGGPSGGAGCLIRNSTSAGGGAVALFVGGELVLDGEIIADGSETGSTTGSGSGGSILVQAGVLAGSGAVRANGGFRPDPGPGFCNGGGGAGGGGRIAVYAADSSQWTGTMEARAGNLGQRGGAGTVYFSAGGGASPRLIIDNTGAGGPVFVENGTTPLAGEVVVGGVLVRGGARLAGDPNGDDLRLYSAEDVVIDASGLVSVSEFVPWGLGQSPGQSGGASGGGGGHAGDGGFGGNNRFDGNGGAGGMEIGHPSLDPPTRGSGGGISTSYGNPGGAGGGYLEVNAAGMLVIDGSLNADGSMGSGNAGGGSGGGILLRAGTITGAGTLSVQGGDGGLGQAI